MKTLAYWIEINNQASKFDETIAYHAIVAKDEDGWFPVVFYQKSDFFMDDQMIVSESYKKNPIKMYKIGHRWHENCIDVHRWHENCIDVYISREFEDELIKKSL